MTPTDRYVLVSYILANPIDLPWAPSLHMYPWSSLGALVTPDRHVGVNRWLHHEVVRQLYDVDDLVVAVESRRRSLTAPLEAEVVASLRKHAGDLDWSDVLMAVESGRFVSGERVGDGVAKAVAVLIAIDVLGWPRERVQRCAEVSASGLRSTIGRSRLRMESAPSFALVLKFAIGVLCGVPVGV